MSRLVEQIKQAVAAFVGCKTTPALIGGLVVAAHFVDRDAARAQVFVCIESVNNRQRLHSSLDYRSPEPFENMVRVTN